MQVSNCHSTRRKGNQPCWTAVWVLLLGLLVGGLCCSTERDAAQPVELSALLQRGAAAGFNLLLITLDTARPDRLGCYGYKEGSTPAIDSLLGHGVRFDDAVTSVPITLPSHATIMTGQYPPAIGVRDNGTYHLAEEHTTLAEILQDNGYDTVAFVASFVLDNRFGLAQGFDFYEFKAGPGGPKGGSSLAYERQADAVSDSAIQWLEARHESDASTPFFMWVHYYDPHVPYESPLGRKGQSVSQQYDAEITFADMHLKRLLDLLDHQNLRDRTLIALVTDHGEGLDDHNEATHGIFIYETTMRVAFILSCPALFDASYRVDDRVVATVDILPTVVDLLGIDSSAQVDGCSLLAAAVSPGRAVYIETQMPIANACSPLYGLRRHTDKYIQAPRPEYYVLKNDPQEQRNLYGTATASLDDLKQRLAKIMETWAAEGASHSGARELTAEEQARLEALGYVVRRGPAETGSLPDPKDQISIINKMTRITRLMARGRDDKALALAEKVAAQSQGWYDPIAKIAEIHWKLGRRAEAVRVLEEFTDRHPSVQGLEQLATALLRLERYDQCLRKLEAAERLDPQSGAIRLLHGDVFFRQMRYAEAIEQYTKAIDLDPERVGSQARQKIETAKQHLGERATETLMQR